MVSVRGVSSGEIWRTCELRPIDLGGSALSRVSRDFFEIWSWRLAGRCQSRTSCAM